MTDCLQEHGVQWVACAGYIRLLSSAFVNAWPNRILNIHPALLPAFPGMDAQGQAHNAGVQIAGATVHLVDAGCDTGPILAQGATAVLPGDSRDTLQQRILRIEHQLYPRVVRWAAEGRIRVNEGVVQVDLAENETRFLWLDPQ
jgi:phosphoribosylglycinamide formyltransferase-1